MQRPKSNIGLYFHKLSKDRTMGGRVRVPAKVEDYPKNWIDLEYKVYKNAEEIKLKQRSENDEGMDLLKVLVKRNSSFDLPSKNKISLENLNTIINYSLSIKNIGKGSRMYPSAGARYSIESYFLVQNSDDLKTGLYHYNVLDHTLEFIKEIKKENTSTLSKYNWLKDVGVVMFMTSIFDRNIRKYGERGYRYIMFEAGHIGQNIYLTNTMLDIPVSSIGGVEDEKIEEFLGIDGEMESVIYTMVFG